MTIYEKKRKERAQKFKETEGLQYICQDEVDKALKMFLTWHGFRHLTRITTSGKILLDKLLNIAKNEKHDDYQRGLASMVYKFFDKKVFYWCRYACK